MGTPHGNIGLGGPGLWVIGIGLIVVAVFGLGVLGDIVRRRDRISGATQRLLWAAPQALYLASLAWGLAASAAGLTARAILVTLPVAVIAQIAYVLRVVAPRQPRGAPEDDVPASDAVRVDERPPRPRST